mmetsp:Transcript_13562/g.17563  ORF Transcript_13562/g.17563 Transcript_13562/m.17563 type:complete len:223 (-) Transcript_13562:129-797(-)
MGGCCSLLRRKIQKEDPEFLQNLLKQPSDVELSEIKTETKAKHKSSDCDEALVDLLLESDTTFQQLLNSDEEIDGRRVQFASVEVRQYSRCMDYHPCVSSGVPLSLDWSFESDPGKSIDEYEKERHLTRVERQKYAYIGRLDPRLRLALALRAGYELEEVEDMVDQVNIARQARAQATAERKQQSAARQQSFLHWMNQRSDRSRSRVTLGILEDLFSGWKKT